MAEIRKTALIHNPILPGFHPDPGSGAGGRRGEVPPGHHISNYRAGPSWNRLIVKYFGDQALRALGRE